MDIAEFVTARLDERAAIAQAALEAAVSSARAPRSPGAWHAPGDDPGTPSSFELTFEPEAILVDIAAARYIVKLHSNPDGGGHECPERDAHGLRTVFVVACPTLKAMAATDAVHPDFKPEWALPNEG